MANVYREPDRRQGFLLPLDMSHWDSETDMIHLLLDVVELMDLSTFESRCAKGGTGAPAFAPRMRVCALLYAYAYGKRSSRRIERLLNGTLDFG